MLSRLADRGCFCSTTRWSGCMAIISGEAIPLAPLNLVQDPNEQKNLADTEKDTLNKLLDKYYQYSKEPRDMQDQGYHDTAKLP